ncbi:MAG TPA: class I SAM-dependent methyltransferase [Solirubrobacteraceae bacterium]
MTAAVDPPPPGVDDRTYYTERVWCPWIEQAMPLAGATMLEYGCGPGSVSRAFAPRVERHIGLDIHQPSVDIARRMAREAGQENSEFHAHPPEEIIDVFKGYAGQVDIVMLYAVIEHLTVRERIEVLAAAREVARPNGVIVVIELPNRLVAWDHHSTWMPFINQLPEPLSLDYLMARGTRPALRENVLRARDPDLPAEADQDALLALERFGRGGSFHEFELAWGGRIDGYVVASNWGPDVLPHREIDPGELPLARLMARLRPDLDPPFSRQWIDLILRPDLPVRRGPFHRPWVGNAGPGSHAISRNLDEVVFVPAPEGVLHVELPEPTRRLAVRVVDGETHTVVEATTLQGERATGEAPGRPGRARSVVIDLPDWADDVEIRLPRGGWIPALTYLGHGPG